MHNYTSYCTLLKKLVRRGGITQVRGHHLALMQVALIAASCCAAPIWSMVVVVVAVACCWCILYQLALMLALTLAPFILTCAPCAYSVYLLSTGAIIPLAQVVGVTSCNLRRWCFFIQPLAQTLYLPSGNLHCVVVLYIYIYIQCKLQFTPLI